MKLLATIIDLVDIEKQENKRLEDASNARIYEVKWWKENVEQTLSYMLLRVSKLQNFCILWSFKFLVILPFHKEAAVEI